MSMSDMVAWAPGLIGEEMAIDRLSIWVLTDLDRVYNFWFVRPLNLMLPPII